MSQKWTTEHVTGLAPDSASVSAGRKLGNSSKWHTLGEADDLLWGEFKGSGKKPYQTVIETTTPAFKCSCPSRKFPCKHSLGIAYIYADSPSAFKGAELPEWVTEWQQRRQQRQKKQAEKADQAKQPVDEKTQQRRAAQQQKRQANRLSNIQEGLDELQRWLHDTIKQGLASAIDNPKSWRRMAKSLVDAQAPGLARQVLSCYDMRYEYEVWQPQMLTALSKIQLLISAWQTKTRLDPEIQADLEDLVGLTRDKEDLLSQDGITDTWRIAGKSTLQQDKLQIQRTWAWGEQQKRWALFLDFAAGSQLPITTKEGHAVVGDLVFYPSSWPRRAIIKEQKSTETLNTQALHQLCHTIDTAHHYYAQTLSQYPWLDQLPIGLTKVSLTEQADKWMLTDQHQSQLPISKRFNWPWEMLAVSGGQAIDLFGEWDGQQFLPLTMIIEDHVISFNDLRQEVL